MGFGKKADGEGGVGREELFIAVNGIGAHGFMGLKAKEKKTKSKGSGTEITLNTFVGPSLSILRGFLEIPGKGETGADWKSLGDDGGASLMGLQGHK
jgi:hypothetical protein